MTTTSSYPKNSQRPSAFVFLVSLVLIVSLVFCCTNNSNNNNSNDAATSERWMVGFLRNSLNSAVSVVAHSATSSQQSTSAAVHESMAFEAHFEEQQQQQESRRRRAAGMHTVDVKGKDKVIEKEGNALEDKLAEHKTVFKDEIETAKKEEKAKTKVSLKNVTAAARKNETEIVFPRDPLWDRFYCRDNSTLTFVVQLAGEMANNMFKFAQTLGYSLWLERKHKKKSCIILKNQASSKWIGASRNMKAIFPFCRDMDFQEGGSTHEDEFKEKKDAQTKWLGNDIYNINEQKVRPLLTWELLDTTLNLLTDALHNTTDKSKPTNITHTGNISMPFFYSCNPRFFAFDIITDEYYQEIRNMFQIDESACLEKPYPDETVFHFRNFLHEMPKHGKGNGFAEMGPNQTARDLFGHLKKGDKVAIISRFEQKYAQDYVDALKRRHLNVRFISGQSGPQDFCFLMHAKKEIIGIRKSTYVQWASVLSNATNVVLYMLAVEGKKNRVVIGSEKKEANHKRYNWTNPVVEDRFDFATYTVDQSIDPEYWHRVRQLLAERPELRRYLKFTSDDLL